MERLELSDFLGKQYKAGSRGPNDFDCWGLCLAIADRLGKKLPPIVTPDTLENKHMAFLAGAEMCVELDKPKPWCVVAFAIKAPYVTHMGIVLDDCKRFIHIMRKRSVAIERLDHPVWSRKIAGYYEHR